MQKLYQSGYLNHIRQAYTLCRVIMDEEKARGHKSSSS